MASTATPSPVGSFITTKRRGISSSSSSSSSSVMMTRTHLLSSSPVLFLKKKQSVFQSTASATQWKSRRSFRTVVFATTAEETSEKKEKRYPGEGKGFVEEMRFVAMKLHTKDQAKEGEREAQAAKPIGKMEPSIEGYLKFLVDSKVVYDSLESIVQMAAHPWYSEFKNTGLERSEKLAKDLEWFKEQGHTIPEPSSPGKNYASYLVELSENDPQAFICHFYNVYFAHSAGGRMIGRKVAEKILDGRELEFYKWDGDLSELLQNVRDKINRIANSWSREEKNHCLEQTEMSFKWSGEILRLVLS